MKDKLEPNMYVRTKDGDMFILDKIEDNHLIPRYVHIPYIITEEDVLKTSYNIIDLIEVGDYVNGLPVRFVEESRVDIGQAEDYFWLKNQHIKSIVTHEQMEQMAYKVGE